MKEEKRGRKVIGGTIGVVFSFCRSNRVLRFGGK